MPSTELISIIIAIVALIGTIANASLTVWEKIRTERRKRYYALADVVAKYRDPLHLAAEDLASKITNIVETGLGTWVSEEAGRARQEYAMLHTAFVFGQFFCWLYIIRRDTQFLLPSTRYDEESGALRTILHNIRLTLRSGGDDSLFMILTGEQEAMGEVMTVMDGADPDEEEKTADGVGKRSGGQCRCIGYASFVRKWKRDAESREWFGMIVSGLKELNRLSQADRAGARIPRRRSPPDERLRRLQHQLVDLIECLDPRGLHSKSTTRCAMPARGCLCRGCEGRITIHGASVGHGEYAGFVGRTKKIEGDSALRLTPAQASHYPAV
ncbi:hypothetical protein FPV67DRAFT_1416496 [Lyophyllum atratum]|nr:hypothetical protein FPV67DRAFT_1416496 [Lyophyllum atratum]